MAQRHVSRQKQSQHQRLELEQSTAAGLQLSSATLLGNSEPSRIFLQNSHGKVLSRLVMHACLASQGTLQCSHLEDIEIGDTPLILYRNILSGVS